MQFICGLWRNRFGCTIVDDMPIFGGYEGIKLPTARIVTLNAVLIKVRHLEAGQGIPVIIEPNVLWSHCTFLHTAFYQIFIEIPCVVTKSYISAISMACFCSSGLS